MNILVEGTTPFRLLRRIEDLPYPAGDVELLDDLEDGDPEAAAAARARYADLVERVTDERPEADALDDLDAYGMAATLDVAADAKQSLLEQRSENVTDEEFAPYYSNYLAEARASAPHAWIFAMEPLIGRHDPVIKVRRREDRRLEDRLRQHRRLARPSRHGRLHRHRASDGGRAPQGGFAPRADHQRRDRVAAAVLPGADDGRAGGGAGRAGGHRDRDARPRAGAARRADTTRGTVLVTPPDGFTVDGSGTRSRSPTTARRPCSCDCTARFLPARRVSPVACGSW